MTSNCFTLTHTLRLLRQHKLSLAELYTDVRAAMQAKNADLNIYLAQNTQAEQEARQRAELPLGGVPLAIKDNFLTQGMITTASAKVLDNFLPPYESTVSQRLIKEGAVFVGKTNMDAWAHGSSTETSDFGATSNPRNPDHLPGGSSGGSAAAVAADMCIAAIGSETAGSVRQPSAWCGTVGLKPTYGRVSRAGVVAMGSSLDCPGPITKTVADAAVLLEYMAGQDPYDATTSSEPVSRYREVLNAGVKNKRIGLLYLDHPEMKSRSEHVVSALETAAKVFEGLGAIVEKVPLSDSLQPNTILNPDYAIAVYTVVQRGEVSSNLARYDGVRYGHGRDTFGAEAKRRIMLGTFTLSKGYADKYYLRAQQVRSLFMENFRQLFSKYDLLIAPTSPGFALKHGATANNPMFGELEDMLVEPSSISGLPGINVPCFHDTTTNLYLGMNIMANHWQEEAMIAAAAAYEAATDWNSWVKQIET